MLRYAISIPFLISLIVGAAVSAQTWPGNPDEGRQLAVEVCSACHLIDKGEHGVSPEGAPAFQDVADDPAATPISLRVFLRSPHENMPDLMLTHAEVDNAIAYILSLE